jgi:diacylglycerol kinase (ATP)
MPTTDGLRGWARLVRATRVGVSALSWGFRNEEAIRLELLGIVVLFPLGLWLGRDGVERALLAGSVLVVLMAELLNTGIEIAIDRISYDHHELSGRAKDMGSAGVMVSLAIAATTWACILWDY